MVRQWSDGSERVYFSVYLSVFEINDDMQMGCTKKGLATIDSPRWG